MDIFTPGNNCRNAFILVAPGAAFGFPILLTTVEGTVTPGGGGKCAGPAVRPFDRIAPGANPIGALAALLAVTPLMGGLPTRATFGGTLTPGGGVRAGTVRSGSSVSVVIACNNAVTLERRCA